MMNTKIIIYILFSLVLISSAYATWTPAGGDMDMRYTYGIYNITNITLNHIVGTLNVTGQIWSNGLQVCSVGSNCVSVNVSLLNTYVTGPFLFNDTASYIHFNDTVNNASIIDLIAKYPTGNTTLQIWNVINNNTFTKLSEFVNHNTTAKHGNTSSEITAVTNPLYPTHASLTGNYSNTMHLNGDNWNGDDWITYTSPNFIFNETQLETKYYNATQSLAVAGTVNGGTLTDTQHDNGVYDGKTFNFSEASGSPGLDLRINFTGVPEFNQGVMRYKTSSLAGNYPIIQMWNYDTSAWEDYPPVSESLTFATIEQPVFDSTDHIQNNVAQMRIYKASNGNTNNKYYVDWIAVAKGFGTPSGEEVDPYSWHRNTLSAGNYNASGNISADKIYGNSSWIHQSYPTACTSGSWISALGDSTTCTSLGTSGAFISYSGYTLTFSSSALNETLLHYIDSHKTGNTTAEIVDVINAYPTGNNSAQLTAWLNTNRTNGNIYFKHNVSIGGSSTVTPLYVKGQNDGIQAWFASTDNGTNRILIDSNNANSAVSFGYAGSSKWGVGNIGTTTLQTFAITPTGDLSGTPSMKIDNNSFGFTFANPSGNDIGINITDVNVLLNLVSTGASNNAYINWYRGATNFTWSLGLGGSYNENLLFTNDAGTQLKLDYQGNATFSKDVIANMFYGAGLGNTSAELTTWLNTNRTGGNVYYSGKVGIGTTPLYPLDVIANEGKAISVATTGSSGVDLYGIQSSIISTATSNNVYGIESSVTANNSQDVYGYKTTVSGASSDNVKGVVAQATGTGVVTGIYGSSIGGAGSAGLWGYTPSANSYGIYGIVADSSSYSGYFTGGKGVYVDSNISTDKTVNALNINASHSQSYLNLTCFNPACTSNISWNGTNTVIY